MELHIWEGKGCGTTIELTEAQEEAVVAILGLDIDSNETSYRCYSDESVAMLTEHIKKSIRVRKE